MVALRGGLQNIEESLHMKISRSGTEGAVNTLSQPHLQLVLRAHPPISDSLNLPTTNFGPQQDAFSRLLRWAGTFAALQQALLKLQSFSHTLRFLSVDIDAGIHPRAFDEDVLFLRHELLSLRGTAQQPLDSALIVAAFVYIKTITREMPLFAASSSLLVDKLRTRILRAEPVLRSSHSVLWLWSMFMGANRSTGTLPQEWFTQQIGLLMPASNEPSFGKWNYVKELLMQVLWINTIHEKPCLAIWQSISKPHGSGLP